MAAKLSSYPIERRLKPIYEWLDNGNNKKALQEAEKVLKKQPTSQCAKALKCLALLRLGKESDCVEQLEAVRKEIPVEDSTLQAMAVCYREIHKPRLICELYKGANEKHPGNEDMQVHLFHSYVRVSDYGKQHHTSMALYRLRPKNQYYFWAAMSILLEAFKNPADILQYCIPPLSSSVEELLSTKKVWNDSQMNRLKLIEKILDKIKDKFESVQEVLFYMLILEMQGKYNEGLVLLGTSLGEKLDHNSRVNKKVALLMKLERWPEAIVLLRSLILENCDSWSHIIHFIEAVFQLYDSSGSTTTVEKEHEFICGLCQMKKPLQQPKRGPILALLEYQAHLEKRMLLKHFPSGNLVDLMIQYMNNFGSSECCLRDLKKYVSLLTQNEIKDFLNQVWKLVHLEHGEFPNDKKQMLLHLSNLELSRAFGIPTNGSPEECKEAVLSLLKYLLYGHNSNDEMPETEIRSCDRYALLAAHIMFDLWSETNVSQCLFEAIVLCEYALSFSPSNSQLKLLQLKFYHLLGGTQGAHETYVALDIKHMQLDTLGYLHALPLITNGHYSLAVMVLGSTMKFFSNNFKESADHITYAYKYEAYMKIPESIDIRDKINNSVHYMQVTLEKMLLDILHSTNFSGTIQVVNEMEITPLEDKMQWEKLRDNRDFNVLWELDHQNRSLTEEAVEITINHEIVLLRLRQLILRIIVAIVHVSSGYNKSNGLSTNSSDCGYISDYSSSDSSSKETIPSYSMSTLTELIAVLESSLAALNINYPTPVSKNFIAAPPTSRLLILLENNYFGQILEVLKLIISLIPGQESSEYKALSHTAASVMYFDDVEKNLSKEILEMDNYSCINNFIQRISLYTELISFSYIIIGACDHILKQILVTVKKNKKKKEINTSFEPPHDIDWRVNIISNFSNFLSENIEKVTGIMKQVQVNFTDIKQILGEVSIIQEVEDKVEKGKLLEVARNVNDSIIASYISCIVEMTSVLKLKVKYTGNAIKH